MPAKTLGLKANRTFINNTIKSAENYNRRKQEKELWTEHQRESQHESRTDTKPKQRSSRKRGRAVPAGRGESMGEKQAYDAEREFWQNSKRIKLAEFKTLERKKAEKLRKKNKSKKKKKKKKKSKS